MIELLLNILIIVIIGLPLFLLEILRGRSAWVEENHGVLSIVSWLAILFAVYFFILPKFNLAPNPEFFRHMR